MKYLATLLAAFIAVSPAQANWLDTPRCTNSVRANAVLNGTYGETIQEADTRSFPEGDPVLFWAVWANEDNGSWSLTFSNGPMTCLAAMGMNYSGQTLDDLLMGESL